MLQQREMSEASFRLRAVNTAEAGVPICGEFPLYLKGGFPARYYRRMERLLCVKCAALPKCAAISLRTVLYLPEESICSVLVEAELTLPDRRLPFFTDGCVWDLRHGCPLPISRFAGTASRRKLRTLFLPRREPAWLLRTCPDLESRCFRAMAKDRFYLEKDAVVLYFPPLTLEPVLENRVRLPRTDLSVSDRP